MLIMKYNLVIDCMVRRAGRKKKIINEITPQCLSKEKIVEGNPSPLLDSSSFQRAKPQDTAELAKQTLKQQL